MSTAILYLVFHFTHITVTSGWQFEHLFLLKKTILVHFYFTKIRLTLCVNNFIYFSVEINVLSKEKMFKIYLISLTHTRI